MQSVIVLTSLVSELVGGGSQPPALSLTSQKNTLILLRVKTFSIMYLPSLSIAEFTLRFLTCCYFFDTISVNPPFV